MSERITNFLLAVEVSGIFLNEVCTRAGVPASTPHRWKNGGPTRGTAAIEALEVALCDLIDERINNLPNLKKTLKKARAFIVPEAA